MSKYVVDSIKLLHVNLQRLFQRSNSFVAPTRPTIKVTDEKSAIVEVS